MKKPTEKQPIEPEPRTQPNRRSRLDAVLYSSLGLGLCTLVTIPLLGPKVPKSLGE